MSSALMSITPAPSGPSWRRGPSLLIGGLVLVGVLTFLGGLFMKPVSEQRQSTPVAELQLRFVDRADGGVGVINAVDGNVVTEIAPGQDNFVRATMRGLARQRFREGVAVDIPFVLTAWADGRLTLVDPGTHRAVELVSFGATNEADFARMLHLPEVL